MMRNLKLRSKFRVILVVVYIVSLPFMIMLSYYVLKGNAVREVMQQSNLLLAAWEGAGFYATKVLRPMIARDCGEISTPEKLKALFIADEMEKQIRSKVGDYSFRRAATNPMNFANKADPFEEQKLIEFREGKITKEWRGLKNTPKGEFYLVMRPVVVAAECLRCHGDPASAPETIRTRYGTTNGYNWPEGEISTLWIIEVPTDIPIASAKKALLFFSLIYTGFFFAVLISIDRLIEKSVIAPIEEFAKIADEVSRGRFEREFTVKTNDEIKTLADAFTRMKLSLAKAMDIMKRK